MNIILEPVEILLPQSLSWRDSSLHYQHSSRPLNNIKIFIKLPDCLSHLSHPLILDLSNLGVGVSHHSDQQVEKENHHDGDEDEEVNLPDDFVVGVGNTFPDEADISEAHEEHSQN